MFIKKSKGYVESTVNLKINDTINVFIANANSDSDDIVGNYSGKIVGLSKRNGGYCIIIKPAFIDFVIIKYDKYNDKFFITDMANDYLKERVFDNSTALFNITITNNKEICQVSTDLEYSFIENTEINSPVIVGDTFWKKGLVYKIVYVNSVNGIIVAEDENFNSIIINPKDISLTKTIEGIYVGNPT